MIKLTALALVMGLATTLSVLPSNAQFAAAGVPGGPNKPNTPTASASTSWDCSREIGAVRRISADDIAKIRDQRVWLFPICEEPSILPTDDYDWLFRDGNAFTLRQPIAGNAAMMRALRARNYDEHDVISVVFAAGNSIMVYVHQRAMN